MNTGSPITASASENLRPNPLSMRGSAVWGALSLCGFLIAAAGGLILGFILMYLWILRDPAMRKGFAVESMFVLIGALICVEAIGLGIWKWGKNRRDAYYCEKCSTRLVSATAACQACAVKL